jgi:hypothetical protein
MNEFREILLQNLKTDRFFLSLAGKRWRPPAPEKHPGMQEKPPPER